MCGGWGGAFGVAVVGLSLIYLAMIIMEDARLLEDWGNLGYLVLSV